MYSIFIKRYVCIFNMNEKYWLIFVKLWLFFKSQFCDSRVSYFTRQSANFDDLKVASKLLFLFRVEPCVAVTYFKVAPPTFELLPLQLIMKIFKDVFSGKLLFPLLFWTAFVPWYFYTKGFFCVLYFAVKVRRWGGVSGQYSPEAPFFILSILNWI